MKILLALLFLCTAAQAQQTTYVYTGQPMGSNIATGTVVLAQPLPANGTSVVTPVSYSFTGNLGVNTQDADPIETYPSLVFSFTTVNGVITAWDIELSLGTGQTTASISVTSAGDSYLLQSLSGGDCTAGHGCILPPPIVASNTTPGTWSMPQAQVAPAMAAMKATIATAQTDVGIYGKAYLQENGTINAQNAALMVCRANGGWW
jgi:hypothetical protein